MEYKQQVVLKPKIEGEKSKTPSFEDVKKEWLNGSLSEKELVSVFDQKYPNDESFHGMTLLNDDGSPMKNKDDARVFIDDLANISESDKKRHMRGYLKKFDTNIVDYVLELSKEKEVLAILEKNGSNIKKMVEGIMKNGE